MQPHQEWGAWPFLLPMSDITHISQLTHDPKNARSHNPRNIGQIVDSLQEVGAARSIVIDEHGRILAGNGTIDAAGQAGIERVQVVDADGETIVAVRRSGLTDAQKTRLALADNRTSELATWDPSVLAELNADNALEGLWRPEEIDALLATLNTPIAGAGGDDFDTTPQEGPTRVQPGDLWQLGEHRLLCGDSTKAEDVGRLMGGEKAQAVVTDSPYGIERKGIANDTEEGLLQLFEGVLANLPADNAVVINFQSPRLFPAWIDAIRAHGHQFERALWFYDETDVTFPWRGWLMTSQIALVSSVGKPKWNDKGPYHHDCYMVKTAGRQDDSGGHTTAKPLDVVQDLIAHTTGLLYDPFLGSGTTLIAAERLGRKCYGLEISERYCDVILKRFTVETGIEPILLSNVGTDANE